MCVGFGGIIRVTKSLDFGAGMQFWGFGMCPRCNRVKHSTYKILGLREAIHTMHFDISIFIKYPSKVFFAT